jgi:hypothetical protein
MALLEFSPNRDSPVLRRFRGGESGSDAFLLDSTRGVRWGLKKPSVSGGDDVFSSGLSLLTSTATESARRLNVPPPLVAVPRAGPPSFDSGWAGSRRKPPGVRPVGHALGSAALERGPLSKAPSTSVLGAGGSEASSRRAKAALSRPQAVRCSCSKGNALLLEVSLTFLDQVPR